MITAKQQRILDFIKRYMASNGVSPTLAEIGRFFQMRSSASVHAHLRALKEAGLIEWEPHKMRAIRLVVMAVPQASADRLASSL